MSVNISEPTPVSNDQILQYPDNIGNNNKNGFINNNSVWVPDSFSNNCLKCNSQFIPFFNGKHHCRICGLLYCDDCCSNFLYYQTEKIIPLKSPYEEENKNGPYRTCNSCYEEFKKASLVKTTSFDNSTKKNYKKEEECPVCGKSVSKTGHGTVEECFTKTTNDYQNRKNSNNRMLVYNMTLKEIEKHQLTSNGDFDCPICFEDFCSGDKVGRLECLCLYHYDCIKSWFEKKRSKLRNNHDDLTVQISRNWCPMHDALS